MTVARRTAVVAGLLASIFGGVGLLLYLFVPYFVADTFINHSYPAESHPIAWPLHYSLFYWMTHAPNQRATMAQVASLFAGYLLLMLLVAHAAARQARHTSVPWMVLLWLATVVLAVEVISVAVNARDLLLPFLIPPLGSTYLVTYLLPSVAFAVLSALAALAMVTAALTHPHAYAYHGQRTA